ncbi:helix-turn-helix transcriptional regulator [Nodosilinea sp. LEGE 07298]|uniref:helix-turn-helix domain-containing protein n=1 Tax=Nodosilinea sp. LEGE 07298 TaxID=2777970 RepID=UPI00187E4654|nr:AraC family transcriptional regulator [Nodosilinea sp. LEGE 07298]MBE9111194.1 helix-turn-helix transcriptional regulator [Nodosilinea sp. LEGE 07298]
MPTQQLPEIVSNHPKRLPEVFKQAPTLTSLNSKWNGITLEAFCLPPGETPEFCLEHYVIGISLGQRVHVNQVVEGKFHKTIVLHGAIVICPIHSRHFFRWDNEMQTLSLSLQPELLNLHALELLGTDGVELIPKLGIQDGLIYQIGLALQAELRSQGCGSRLYAETLANTLTIHLLRHYSTQNHRTLDCNGGLAQHKLKLVTDYINNYLERELSLKELAAIAQMSQYHFCRAFKQATGFSPHQYLIRQRVERAKQLLKKGGMSLSAAAIACGFTHQSHLHRHFKRLTGVTPTTFLNS